MMALNFEEKTSTIQRTVSSYRQWVTEDRNTAQLHRDAGGCGAELPLVPRWHGNGQI